MMNQKLITDGDMEVACVTPGNSTSYEIDLITEDIIIVTDSDAVSNGEPKTPNVLLIGRDF